MTRNRIAFAALAAATLGGCGLNSIPSISVTINATVTVPVSNSAPIAGMPDRCQRGPGVRPTTFS